MARRCDICNKGTTFGNVYTRRGVAIKKGGVGIKIARKNHRRFLPNLTRVRAVVNGAARRQRVCTSCLRSGLVVKAP